MSFARGEFPSASKITALKARVKAEMLRRDGYGSLTTYGGAGYDYSIIPKRGNPPKIEHYSKIRDVQANITTSGLPSTKHQGNLVTDMVAVEAKQTLFEAQPRSAISNNDCAASCSGMCVTQCTTTCTNGCIGGCTSCTGCTGGCTGCSGCGGSCTGSCSVVCGGNCTGGCTVVCGGNCTSCTGCSGACSGSCTGCSGCSGCRSGCTACNAGCTTGCTTSCGSCSSSCGGCQGCSGLAV